MKEIIINEQKLIIRKANKADARALVEYLNVVGGESDFLTFGIGEFEISIEQEEKFIEESLKKDCSFRRIWS